MNGDTRDKPPAAYELKRLVAAHRPAFWKSDLIVRLPVAPIYVFPDQEAFDSEDVERLARRLITDPLRLPHSSVIYEVVDAKNGGRSSVVYARQEAGTSDAVLFARPGRPGRWTDAICHAHHEPDGSGWCELNPRVPLLSREDALHIVQGMLIRATALIMAEACREEVHLPRLRRMMLAKQGVAGWSYRLASLDLSKLRRSVDPQGGTHASPRWHIRRGHWRQLGTDRRVFVRECRVGDPARGGVVKDYRVSLGEAA
jgi:hypothetical protein